MGLCILALGSPSHMLGITFLVQGSKAGPGGQRFQGRQQAMGAGQVVG